VVNKGCLSRASGVNRQVMKCSNQQFVNLYGLPLPRYSLIEIAGENELILTMTEKFSKRLKINHVVLPESPVAPTCADMRAAPRNANSEHSDLASVELYKS